jgi:hypothetical protein
MTDTTIALSDMIERLQRLEDMNEIRELYVDHGRDEIGRVAAATISPAEAGKGAVHVLGSPSVELDGDTASGECVRCAVATKDDGTPRVIVGRRCGRLIGRPRWTPEIARRYPPRRPVRKMVRTLGELPS